jgi:hypothetical protein
VSWQQGSSHPTGSSDVVHGDTRGCDVAQYFVLRNSVHEPAGKLERFTGVPKCWGYPLADGNAVVGEAGRVPGVYHAVGVHEEVADAVQQAQPFPGRSAHESWQVNRAGSRKSCAASSRWNMLPLRAIRV